MEQAGVNANRFAQLSGEQIALTEAMRLLARTLPPKG